MKNKLIAKLDDTRLKAFWSFITERQDIYWRRQAGKQRPWTKDPILDKLLFCNVYRELDRGTQYAIDNILTKYKKPSDILFRTMMYRMFNEPRTYEFLSPYIRDGKFDGRTAGKELDRKRHAGIRLFRSAWMVSGIGIQDMSKAHAYCLELMRVNRRIDYITKKLLEIDSIEDAWKWIRASANWFGWFNSYQVILDLSYLPFFKNKWMDFDKWVYPGPGALMGLLWLMGHMIVKKKGSHVRDRLSMREAGRLIHHLTKYQDKYFKTYGLKFKRWENKRLDIHNVEFALCEFNKYMRAHHGGKKKKYVPYGE